MHLTIDIQAMVNFFHYQIWITSIPVYPSIISMLEVWVNICVIICVIIVIIDRYMRTSILSIFKSNFHLFGVVLYGVRNILSLGTIEMFHFGSHNGGFL